jgi:hypothetical protein
VRCGWKGRGGERLLDTDEKIGYKISYIYYSARYSKYEKRERNLIVRIVTYQ